MSAGLKNGRRRQPEQADVGSFQSHNDPETTPNTVGHNMSASAGDIYRLKPTRGWNILASDCYWKTAAEPL